MHATGKKYSRIDRVYIWKEAFNQIRSTIAIHYLIHQTIHGEFENFSVVQRVWMSCAFVYNTIYVCKQKHHNFFSKVVSIHMHN